MPRPIRRLLMGLFCLLLLGAAPRGVGLPTNVCLGAFCGPAQSEIWNRFLKAGGLDPGQIPGVFSGVCYHHARYLDPHQPQYAGILIDRVDGGVFFDGRFSFFKKRHPYAGLDLAAARRWFTARHHVDLLERYAYSEAEDSRSSYRYWFRQDPDRGSLLVVGYFGFTHTILCDLSRNA